MGRDIGIEALPDMIEYFQQHRFCKPVISVMPNDRNDSTRDSLEAIAEQWDSNFEKDDILGLSSVMKQFVDAIAGMPDKRREYIVGEIKKYRDIENPMCQIKGRNTYAFNKSRLDGSLIKTRR